MSIEVFYKKIRHKLGTQALFSFETKDGTLYGKDAICEIIKDYEEYADEQLRLYNVVGGGEQLVCDCKNCKPFPNHAAGFRQKKTCIKDKAN